MLIFVHWLIVISLSQKITKRSVGKMSFVSLEDDSSVDSESECFWNDTSISHHRQNEKCQENGSLTKKKQDIPSIEDVREDSPLSKLLTTKKSLKSYQNHSISHSVWKSQKKSQSRLRRLHFVWTKVDLNCQKMVHFGKFF